MTTDFVPTEDPDAPPPGRRTGTGSKTVLPFLVRSLAAKPQLPKRQDYTDSTPATSPGDLEPHRPRRKR